MNEHTKALIELARLERERDEARAILKTMCEIVRVLLDSNGGPTDGDDGVQYVMVSANAFGQVEGVRRAAVGILERGPA